jgi:hypothetical protein
VPLAAGADGAKKICANFTGKDLKAKPYIELLTEGRAA